MLPGSVVNETEELTELTSQPSAEAGSAAVEIWRRQWFRATFAAICYAAFLAAFALGTDALSNPLDGDTETSTGVSSFAFVYLSPLATIAAARLLGWPVALLLPVIFVLGGSTALPDCPTTGCRPTDGLAWIGLIEWALVITLPLAMLASYRGPREGLITSEQGRPRAGTWGSSVRAVGAYALLVYIAADAGVTVGVSVSGLQRFLEEAYPPVQFVAVSTIATVAAAYQSDIRIARLLPIGFAVIAVRSFGLSVSDSGVVAVAGWALIIVVPSALIGARLRANSTGRTVDRVKRRVKGFF